jgi:hypothetical protein
MIKKLIKVPAARTLASVGDSSYVVLSDGTVARRLKPVVVNDHPYYNMKIDGVLRRISGRRLMSEAKSLA